MTALKQNKFVNRTLSNACNMNVSSTPGNGVMPFSQLEWDRKREKHSKWINPRVDLQQQDRRMKILWTHVESKYLKKEGGVMVPFKP